MGRVPKKEWQRGASPDDIEWFVNTLRHHDWVERHTMWDRYTTGWKFLNYRWEAHPWQRSVAKGALELLGPDELLHGRNRPVYPHSGAAIALPNKTMVVQTKIHKYFRSMGVRKSNWMPKKKTQTTLHEYFR